MLQNNIKGKANAMSKEIIKELSQEDLDRIPTVVDKWVQIGLSIEAADKAKAEAAIVDVYKAAGLHAPTRFIWCSSPYAGVIEAYKISNHLDAVVLDENKSEITKQLYECRYGSQDAGWLSFYDFFNELLPDAVKPLHGLMELSKHCG